MAFFLKPFQRKEHKTNNKISRRVSFSDVQVTASLKIDDLPVPGEEESTAFKHSSASGDRTAVTTCNGNDKPRKPRSQLTKKKKSKSHDYMGWSDRTHASRRMVEDKFAKDVDELQVGKKKKSKSRDYIGWSDRTHASRRMAEDKSVKDGDELQVSKKKKSKSRDYMGGSGRTHANRRMAEDKSAKDGDELQVSKKKKSKSRDYMGGSGRTHVSRRMAKDKFAKDVDELRAIESFVKQISATSKGEELLQAHLKTAQRNSVANHGA